MTGVLMVGYRIKIFRLRGQDNGIVVKLAAGYRMKNGKSHTCYRHYVENYCNSNHLGSR